MEKAGETSPNIPGVAMHVLRPLAERSRMEFPNDEWNDADLETIYLRSWQTGNNERDVWTVIAVNEDGSAFLAVNSLGEDATRIIRITRSDKLLGAETYEQNRRTKIIMWTGAGMAAFVIVGLCALQFASSIFATMENKKIADPPAKKKVLHGQGAAPQAKGGFPNAIQEKTSR